jgi:hypothetical protein
MHVHTKYSPDSSITAVQLVNKCKTRGIDCICITDHNTIKGAFEFRDKVSIKIVVGEEIETAQGEVIGLFLKQEIPAGLSISETIDIIKEQGGLVYIPHPFDTFRKSPIEITVLEKIVEKIDIIEVFNSRTLFKQANEYALRFARENNILPAVGSDAHTENELGNSYVEMENFVTKEEFVKNLKDAMLFAGRTSLFSRLKSRAMKIIRIMG